MGIIKEVGTERVYEPEAVYHYKENNIFLTHELTVIMLE